jgi:hypothetical protein
MSSAAVSGWEAFWLRGISTRANGSETGGSVEYQSLKSGWVRASRRRRHSKV